MVILVGSLAISMRGFTSVYCQSGTRVICIVLRLTAAKSGLNFNFDKTSQAKAA